MGRMVGEMLGGGAGNARAKGGEGEKESGGEEGGEGEGEKEQLDGELYSSLLHAASFVF